MNKVFKRLATGITTLMLCVSCIAPTSLAASNEDRTPVSPVIQIEYNEYLSSKLYYTNLAKEGYTLVIHVGKENDQAELERISSESQSPADVLQPNLTRELNIPFYRYNVMQYGKKTISGSCDDTLGYLFTNYNYYGCPSYEVSLYNRGDETLKVDLVPEDEYTPFISYKIPSESTVIKYVTEPAWYGRFKNPCSVFGYVTRDL